MRIIELFHVVRSFLRSEVESARRFDIPWRRRLWLYWHGFLSSKDAVWNLSAGTVDLYLSDFEYRNVGWIDAPYAAGLKNKVLFHLIISGTHDHLLPEVYGLVRDGAFVALGRSGEVRSFDQLVEFLEIDTVVVKPVDGAKGDGVRILDRDGDQLRVDGCPIKRAKLRGLFTSDRDLLLVEHVQQAEYAAAIYPESTNTLRLLTMIDPRTGEPFVASGTHRFGTRSSGHIDNWSAGGVSAGIDLDTGALEAAVSPPRDESPSADRMENHPDTGAQIAGVELPNWDRSKGTVLDLAAEYGWLWPYVGWDVVVTDDQGSIAVLEGEPRSIDADQQAHGPLLADDRVRRFYEHHGVLSDGGGYFSHNRATRSN